LKIQYDVADVELVCDDFVGALLMVEEEVYLNHQAQLQNLLFILLTLPPISIIHLVMLKPVMQLF